MTRRRLSRSCWAIAIATSKYFLAGSSRRGPGGQIPGPLFIMLVLGLDSALQNTGWHLQEVMTGDGSVDTHSLMSYHSGGTFKQSDASEPVFVRAQRIRDFVIALVQRESPDLVVIEGPIEYGAQKSPTGLTVYSVIMMELVNLNQRVNFAAPEYVVTITPDRLPGLIHGKRPKNPAAETAKIYRNLYPEAPRLTQHEAIAYFLCYFGVRFLRTCIQSTWDRSILSPKEKLFFLEAVKRTKRGPLKGMQVPNDMLARKGHQWWQNRV